MRDGNSDQTAFLRQVLDANPCPFFVVDEDIRILEFNEAGGKMLGEAPEQALQQRGGDALHCIRSLETPDGCGHSEACKDCVIRDCVGRAVEGQRRHRVRTRMTIEADGASQDVVMLVTASPFQFDGKALVLLVLEDISEFMELRQLVPICAQCKKIRQDDDYWNAVESFIEKHMDVRLSHGYCPDCAREAIEAARSS